MSDEPEVQLDAAGNAVLNPKIREQMRKQAKENEDLRKQVAELALGGVYSDLAIPTTGAGKFFRDHYDGPTDRASVEAAAKEAGVIGEPSGQQRNEPTAEERAARAEVLERELKTLRSIQSGTSTLGDGETGNSLAEWEAKLRAAKTTTEFDAIVESDEYQRLKSQQIVFG